MSAYVNDGSSDGPKLQVYLNLETLNGLRSDTIWPGLSGLERIERLRADGFQGVQQSEEVPVPAGTTLPQCGYGRINSPEEADPLAAKFAARGDTCMTVHVAWGLEDDATVARLVESVLTASDRHKLPIFIETHRATITQDMWRTVQIVKQFPDVRFNGDFSHYYTGLELVYGDWEEKLAFLEPIFSRVGFMHGRIGNPGSMQVEIWDGLEASLEAEGIRNFLQDFRDLWTGAMAGFLRTAKAGDVLIFCPELLWHRNYYARKFRGPDGALVEESDRYQQALLYKTLAQECFSAARKIVG